MWNVDKFDAIKISIASPADIRKWSHGEIKKPETINYRTHKPERDGLFCEKIFGPSSDWTCACGKYKSIRYKGIKCERCGVEITRAKVRRERMGSIELASPVAHIWYSKGTPNYMALLLDISPKDLEKVIYFNSYIVLDPGNLPLMKKQLLTEKEYRTYIEKYGDLFTAKMGAEAVQELLSKVNLDEIVSELKFKLNETPMSKRANIIKRMEVGETFLKSSSRPEWMILESIPVIPPDLRPMVQLDGGRFATSDLNDLYRRVINRNNRLKKLMELGAPEIIIKNEKRMLQEAVNSLIDNGRRGRPVTGPGKRPLKSLNDMLKGKQGRFRQNLLGKRVDYSGRSVIVVGPELKLHQCGLPKKMALELFKPFIMNKLVSKGIAHNIKSAKKMLERGKSEVWDLLEEVIHHHPVMLNRAPTLHRLGIQAFEPVLVEGKAIKISPLVCKPFNADFDGDQMAVHVPLLIEAQAEARILMLSSHNIFSPASGNPLMSMDQDMALGCFYLTRAYESKNTRLVEPLKIKGSKDVVTLEEQLLRKQTRFKAAEAVVDPKTIKDGAPLRLVEKHQFITEKILKRLNNAKIKSIQVVDQRLFASEEAMKHAFERGLIHLHDKHWVRLDEGRIIETCLGRVIFNEIIPNALGFINKQMKRGEIGRIVSLINEKCKMHATAVFLDEIKRIGFKYATISGVSFALSECRTPKRKTEIMDQAQRRSDDAARRFDEHQITRDDKRQSDIDTWQQATQEVTDDLMQEFKRRDDMGEFNSVYMMSISGARGNVDQVRQLAGMRGLMSNPKGDVIDYPIKSNFRDGLTLTEYFISTYGARKGLVDTALRTADSGYLTRRLVDVAQDVIIREEDCGTEDGIVVHPLRENRKANNLLVDEVIISLAERTIGRLAAADIVHPETREVIVKSGQLITREMARMIDLAEVQMPVSQELIGFHTAEMVLEERTGKMISRPDMEINQFLLDHLHGNRIETVKVKPTVVIRSPLTCKSRVGICQKCYSTDLASGRLVEIGETAGIIAAQSIGEPGTQLTMRTFHIGGIAISQKVEIKAKINGTVDLSDMKWTYTIDRKKTGIGGIDLDGVADDSDFEKDTRRIVLEGYITIRRTDGRDDYYPVPTGAILDPKINDGETISAGDTLCQYNPNIVVTQFDGKVKFERLMVNDGIVVSQDGKIVIETEDGKPLESYKINIGSYLKVEEGDKVDAGDVVAEKVTEQQAAISGIKGRTEFFNIKIKNVKVISDSGIIYVIPEDPNEFKKVSYELPQGVKEFKDEATVASNGVKLRVRSGNEVKAHDELLVITSEIDGQVKLSGKKTIMVKKDNVKEYLVPKDMEMLVDEEKKEITFITDVGGKVKILQPKATTNKTLGTRRVLVTEEQEFHIPLDANLMVEELKVKPGSELAAGTQISTEIPFKTGTDGIVEITAATRKVLDAPIEIGLVEKTLPKERTVRYKHLTIRNIKDLNLAKESSLRDKIVDKHLAEAIETPTGEILLEANERITGEMVDHLLLISPIGGYVKIKNEIEVKNLNAPNLKYYLSRHIARDVLNVKTGQVVATEGQVLDNQMLVDFDRNQLELGPVFVTGTWITVSNEFTLALRDIAPIRDKMLGKITRSDVYSPTTGELLAMANQLINKDLMEHILADSSIKKIELIDRKIFEVPEGAQIKVKDGTQIKAGTELIMPTHVNRIKVITRTEEYEVPEEIELLVADGEEVVEGQMLTRPIPAIVTPIAGKINTITKYNKKINCDVITKITVYSGKEYEIPDGIPIKVKNGEDVEMLTPLTGPIEFERIEEEEDMRRIIRVEHQEKKYKITPELEVLVSDGEEVRIGSRLARLTNFAFESERVHKEKKVQLNRRNIAHLRHKPLVEGSIKIKIGTNELNFFEEVEFAKLKNIESILGKRVDGTITSEIDGSVIVEAENIIEEAEANALLENCKNLSPNRAIFYDAGVNINHALGEIGFEERPANEIHVEYTYTEPGVVRLEHRETKEGKKRTTIGEIIVQSGEAHQILDGAELKVEDGQQVNSGDILAKWGSSSKKTIDIIQGLPRVAELFEARNPKKEAIVAEFEGIVHRSGNNLYIESPEGERKQYKAAHGVASTFIVFDGEIVRSGYPLSDGNIAPKKLRKTAGVDAVRRYLVAEVQHVYKSQGVGIADKHIEIIVRQMLRKITVSRPGDTRLLPRETVTINEFHKENDHVLSLGGEPAEGEQILQGITKASLTTDSFISAASFQETTRVLTQASIKSKVDNLRGLKENLIIGKLIPAGTGINAYRKIELPEPEMEERLPVESDEDYNMLDTPERSDVNVIADQSGLSPSEVAPLQMDINSFGSIDLS